jgi:protein tyrosine phosphatase type IVA
LFFSAFLFQIPFEDGTAPPKDVMSKWRAVVKQVCDGNGRVAIHCVAGLGRAPVLVAIALIDKGLDSAAAVDLIRKERRGAINRKQLDFLRSYKPPSPKVCSIM